MTSPPGGSQPPVSQHHPMVLRGRTESGAEEWACPACGRRMLLWWPPQFDRLVLEPGDVTATHSCSKDGVRVIGVAGQGPPAGGPGPISRGPGPISGGPGPVSRGPGPLASGVTGADLRWLRDNGIDWHGR
jgi:hypothetical protein